MSEKKLKEEATVKDRGISQKTRLKRKGTRHETSKKRLKTKRKKSSETSEGKATNQFLKKSLKEMLEKKKSYKARIDGKVRK